MSDDKNFITYIKRNMNSLSSGVRANEQSIINLQTQDVTFSSNLNVLKSLNVGSSSTLSGSLYVDSTSTFTQPLYVNDFIVNGGQINNNNVTLNSGALIKANSTFSSNVLIRGNLNVLGSSTFVEGTNTVMVNPIIFLADDNVTDVLEIGVVGRYGDASGQHNTGLVRDNSSNQWYLFKTDEVLETTTTHVDFQHPTFELATLNANIDASNINVDGDVTINSNLLLVKNTTISGSLYLEDNATLVSSIHIGNDVTIDNILNVGGNTEVTGSLNINNNVTIASHLQVNDDLNVAEEFSVGGRTTLNDNVNINGNVTIEGDLYIVGTATSINSEQVVVADTMMYMGYDNPANVLDIGLVAKYVDLGDDTFTGLVKKTVGDWELFTTREALQPDSTSIDTGHLTYSHATLHGNINAEELNVNNNVTMNDNKVTGLGTPTDASDAVNLITLQNYVGTEISTKYDKSGGIITGNVTINSKLVIDGTSSLNNNVNIGGYLDVLNLVTLHSNVKIVGNTEIANSLNVTGDLDILGTAEISSLLQVADDVVVKSDLFVTGTTSLGNNVDISGELDMNTNKIVNLDEPTANSDAATKLYVDVKVLEVDPVAKYDKIGGTISGPVTIDGILKVNSELTVADNVVMLNNRITGLGDPVGTQDGVNKQYMEQHVSNEVLLKFDKTGGTVVGDTTITGVLKLSSNDLDMSGNQIINLADPSSNTDAVTKQYVDDLVADLAGGDINITSGGTIAGNLYVSQDLGVGNSITLDGNMTIFGVLDLSDNRITSVADASDDTDVVNKQYLDATVTANVADRFSINGGTINGVTTMNSTLYLNDGIDLRNTRIVNVPDPLIPGHVANRNYVDNLDSIKFDKAGGIITGNMTLNGVISMSGNRIIDMVEPTDISDSATKNYVDMTVEDIFTDTRFTNKYDDAGGLIDGVVTINSQLVVNSYLTVQHHSTFYSGLHLNNRPVQGIRTPLANDEAANKLYVDNELTDVNAHFTFTAIKTEMTKNISVTGVGVFESNLFVNGTLSVGGAVTLQGIVDFSGNVLTNVGDPTDDTHATNRSYVLSQISGLGISDKYDKTGGAVIGNVSIESILSVDGATTMNSVLYITGNVTMNSNISINENMTITKSLYVTEATTINGVTDINDKLTVAGKVTLESTLDILKSVTIAESLRVNGETSFRGEVDMGSTNKIINLSNPTLNTDATTKQYVDGSINTVISSVNSKLNLSGGTLTGTTTFNAGAYVKSSFTSTTNLDMNNNKITNLASATNDGDGVSKLYLDGRLSTLDLSSKVSVTGDTMTGSLIINNTCSIFDSVTLNSNLDVNGNVDVSGVITANDTVDLNENDISNGNDIYATRIILRDALGNNAFIFYVDAAGDCRLKEFNDSGPGNILYDAT